MCCCVRIAPLVGRGRSRGRRRQGEKLRQDKGWWWPKSVECAAPQPTPALHTSLRESFRHEPKRLCVAVAPITLEREMMSTKTCTTPSYKHVDEISLSCFVLYTQQLSCRRDFLFDLQPLPSCLAQPPAFVLPLLCIIHYVVNR